MSIQNKVHFECHRHVLTCKTNPPSKVVALPRLISSGRHSAPMSLKSKSRATFAEPLQALSPSSVRRHPASESELAAILKIFSAKKPTWLLFVKLYFRRFCRKLTFFSCFSPRRINIQKIEKWHKLIWKNWFLTNVVIFQKFVRLDFKIEFTPSFRLVLIINLTFIFTILVDL